MPKLHLDFETASRCNLKEEGLARYAEDPSTFTHCLAYAFDTTPVQILVPRDFAYCLNLGVMSHVTEGGLVYAHNVAFELAIWNQIMRPRFGWPELKPEQCRCTMAQAYAMALPGALENAAPALGIGERKDSAGKRIMLQLCQPKADGAFYTPQTDPEKFSKLYEYCKQDVEVERALHARMMELSASEQDLWLLDYQINQNGILVDLKTIDKAIKLTASEKARLDQEMLKTTGGVVGSCSEVQLLVKWIRSRGVELKGVAKADVLDALDGDLPKEVRQALHLRKEAAKTSTAKLLAMRNRACADGRVRGIHQFHGAGTGRWAGRGVQTQNMSRPRSDMDPQAIEDVIQHLDDRNYIDSMYGPVLDALSDCVRGMIIAPEGKDLVAPDFSNVEGRALAWLAGEEWKLDAFRAFDAKKGPDIYKLTYARSFGIPVATVTKDQRQVGKVEELALGFGGGVGAFQSMAKNYGVKVPDDQANEIKKAWRNAHPAITSYWYALEEAAVNALTKGGPWPVGPRGRQVVYKKAGSFLWCKLPSGRVLCYPYPEIRKVVTPWEEEKDALTYMTVVDPSRKLKILEDPNSSGSWKRISTYGGSLAENVTQAVARDLLADAMKRLNRAKFKIVMHVHDEAVCEVDSNDDTALARIEKLMSQVPAWADGFPIAAEAWRGPRYRK